MRLTPASVGKGVISSPVTRDTSLSEQEVERLRGALRALVGRFPSQSACARETGLRQQAISKVLSGATRPGYAFARELSRVLNVPVDELLGLGSGRTPTMLSAHPDWAAVSGEAVQKAPYLADAIRAISTLHLPHSVRLSRDWLINFAHSYWQGIESPNPAEPRKK